MRSESPRIAPDVPEGSFAVSLQIFTIVFFTFICYFAVGVSMAVIPSYVHIGLGYSSFVAGLTISLQYLATFLTRPYAGKMCDTLGPKKAVMRGMHICCLSGLALLLAWVAESMPWLSLLLLDAGRLLLGVGESLIGTGAIIWCIGRVSAKHTAKIISWNGIATYSALAIGAPTGALLYDTWSLAPIGMVTAFICLAGFSLASFKIDAVVLSGERMPFRSVLKNVLPYGLGLALGTTGFGVLATFVTLYYASHQWNNAAYALSAFGALFIAARLLFPNVINTYGGFRVAIVCFTVESVGLLLLWLAPSPAFALAGAAFVGAGFALVFPSLGVEAVGLVPPTNRGAALGAYTVFADVALGIAGPVAGLIAGHYSYDSAFLFGALASMSAVVLTVTLYRRAQMMYGA